MSLVLDFLDWILNSCGGGCDISKYHTEGPDKIETYGRSLSLKL